MVAYRGTVSALSRQADAWSYLADLRSLPEWDPSVEGVRLLAGEPGEPGSRFEVQVRFLSGTLTLPYVTAFSEPQERVVFRAETESVIVVDEATVRSTGQGSEVTWAAKLELKGLRKVFEPALRVGFHRLGRRAEQGLRTRLAEPVRQSPRGGTS
jgi:carbon monoxide dehydrogenase subunit G